jgi:hypothetical protein
VAQSYKKPNGVSKTLKTPKKFHPLGLSALLTSRACRVSVIILTEVNIKKIKNKNKNKNYM